MKEYRFKFKEKEYVLNEEKLECFFNDDEKPIKKIEIDNILELLTENNKVEFDLEYYSKACEECGNDGNKPFGFLENHFYIFTNNYEYITSSISKDYIENSFSQLRREGKVDDSYIVSVIVCKDCGKYSVEIEQLEM